MRRVGFLVVAVWMTSLASARPASTRAAANQPAKSARVAKPFAKPVAKPVTRTIEPKALAIPTNALLTQYQRVGRDLLLLTNDQRAQIGVEHEDAKLSCADVQALFRSIKLDDAVKTQASRAEAAAVLTEVHLKIQRLRGVAVTQDCLNNPLAKDCT